MTRRRRLRSLSDAELLEELLMALCDCLLIDRPPANRLDVIAACSAEVRRRRYRHAQTEYGCTCWLCFDPEPASITHWDDEPV